MNGPLGPGIISGARAATQYRSRALESEDIVFGPAAQNQAAHVNQPSRVTNITVLFYGHGRVAVKATSTKYIGFGWL